LQTPKLHLKRIYRCYEHYLLRCDAMWFIIRYQSFQVRAEEVTEHGKRYVIEKGGL